jgi:hypothetical protein
VNEQRGRVPPHGDEGLPAPGERLPFDTSEAVLEPQPGTDPSAQRLGRAGRPHLVVVTTRAAEAADRPPHGTALVSRFWHPALHQWSENSFESLEHAMHLFLDESGWVLRQQQALAGPHAYELIFEARREDFSRPSTEEMLQDVGLTAADVADMMDRVDRENGGQT